LTTSVHDAGININGGVMAVTPEGKVKAKIDKLIAKYRIYQAKDAGTGPDQGLPADAVGWYYMASANGYGVKGIPDYIGHYKGWFFGVEAKAPGKKPTGFQALQIKAIASSGGAVFVVDGEESLSEFERWLIGRK
jgi:hypothetical protein